MTCAGHVSIWSWCGSMRSWCWWASCCPPATVTCSIALQLTWAAGRNWSTAHTATHHSMCEWPLCTHQYTCRGLKMTLLMVLCVTVVSMFFVGGQKVPFGLRGCWYDTVDVCIRQLDPIMSHCPLMFRMQGFMWVSVHYIIVTVNNSFRVEQNSWTPFILWYNPVQQNHKQHNHKVLAAYYSGKKAEIKQHCQSNIRLRIVW